jgi:hypothetical protein
MRAIAARCGGSRLEEPPRAEVLALEGQAVVMDARLPGVASCPETAARTALTIGFGWNPRSSMRGF